MYGIDVKKQIADLLKRNAGKEFTINGLAERFGVSRGFVTNSIREIGLVQYIDRRVEKRVVYYSMRKPEQAHE